MSDLRKRYPGHALVTGASSGIGESFARHLAREGLDLVLVARSGEKLEQLAKELGEKHAVDAQVVPADLADPGAPEHVRRQTEARGLRVGFLVNNAGVGAMGPFADIERERLLAMVDLNCRAVVDLTSLYLPDMRQQKQGAIVIVSSVGGYQAVPGNAVYAATKSFDLLLAEALWAELKDEGIDVLGLSPGFTRTNFGVAAGASDPGSGGWSWAEPGDVVQTAISALGKEPSVVHGRINQALVAATALVPRRYAVQLAGNLTSGRQKE